MAPIQQINPGEIAEKARRDILQLLEGVCITASDSDLSDVKTSIGSRKEKPCD
jgi:hypothetical protein